MQAIQTGPGIRWPVLPGPLALSERATPALDSWLHAGLYQEPYPLPCPQQRLGSAGTFLFSRL